MDSEWLERLSPVLHLAGRSTVRGHWSQPRRVIYDHELLVFGPGAEMVFDFDDAPWHCGPNSWLLIPPGLWHSGRGDCGRGVLHTWIHFDWVWAPDPPGRPVMTFAPMAPRAPLYRPAPDWLPLGRAQGVLSNPEAYFEAQERLCQVWRAGSMRERLLARAALLELFLGLWAPREQAESTPSLERRQAERVRAALQEIAAQPFARADSVRLRLARLQRSPDHLARVFKRQYGMTPLAYVNALRMERARLLLRDTPQSVAEVAQRLGYPDPVYFARAFRRARGHAPHERR